MKKNIRENVGIKDNVVIVKENSKTGEKQIWKTHNIVPTLGSKYYAQKICGETPTTDFAGANAGLRLGSDTTTPTTSDTDVTTFIATTGKAKSSGYPKTNDTDVNNTGSGVNVVTWKYAYAAGDIEVNNIKEGAIVDNRTTPTASLSHFLTSSTINMGASDTLSIYVNHALANNT